MSGLLDIENRVDLAVQESLKDWESLTALIPAANVLLKAEADKGEKYPALYVEAFDLAEFGRRTGWYLGGLRMGGISFQDDDRNRSVCKKIQGAAHMWVQQENVVELLNATASAQTFGNHVTFEDVVDDRVSFWRDDPRIVQARNEFISQKLNSFIKNTKTNEVS